MWIKTKDLHDILANDVPGGNSDPGRAAVMRAFEIPERLLNPLSSSATKSKIVILAVWQGLGLSRPTRSKAKWNSEISLILVDFNRLAILTILPLLKPAVSRESLRAGNEVTFNYSER